MNRSLEQRRRTVYRGPLLFLALIMLGGNAPVASTPTPPSDTVSPAPPQSAAPAEQTKPRRFRRLKTQRKTPKSSAVAQPRVEREVAWGPGEAMTCAVRIAGVEAGRGALVIGTPGKTHTGTLLWVRAVGETLPALSALVRARGELSVQVDLDGLRPHRGRSDRTIADKTKQTTSQTQGSTVELDVRSHGVKRKITRRFRQLVDDPITALLKLRSLPEADLRRFETLVLLEDQLYRLSLTLSAAESLRTKAGTYDCLRLTGQAVPVYDSGRPKPSQRAKKVTLWISRDERRLPVRLEAETILGPIRVDLLTHQAPSEPAVITL